MVYVKFWTDCHSRASPQSLLGLNPVLSVCTLHARIDSISNKPFHLRLTNTFSYKPHVQALINLHKGHV